MKDATIATRTDALEEALRRYLETGDEAAMEEIVAGTRARLLAAARRIGNPQDAEDAVQAAYLSLVRRRGTPFEAPVVAWLLTAVVRIAYRRKAVLRREDRIAERLARESGAGVAPRDAVDAAGPDDLDRLRREVARLPARYRDPVVLHHFQGLSSPEAARILDLPEATVRTRLRRARLLVRARWSPRWVAAAMSVPWLVSDAWQAAPSGALAAAGGGAMKGVGVAATVGLVAAAAGAFVGSRWLGTADESNRVERLEVDLREAHATLASREDEIARLRQQEAARLAPAPVEAPRGVRADAREVSPPPEEGAAPAAKTAPRSPGAPRFAFPSEGDALERVDWKEVGISLAAMPALMEHLAKELAKGTPFQSIPEIGTIQQHNGALVKMALQLNGKVPGHGPNGTYTHPYVQANAIAAALEAARLPLSSSQATALEAAAREHGEAEDARIAGYPEDEMALRKLFDEAEARERFFEAAFAILNEAQRNALRPPGTRDVLQGDLFSSGLVWTQYAMPMSFAERAALLASMEQKVLIGFAIPEARWPDAKALVEQWAASFPPESLSGETGPLEALGMLSLSRVREAARLQLELQQRLVTSAGLDADSVAKIRAYEAVHVPVKSASK